MASPPLYAARTAPSLVVVPPFTFLTIEGRGDPHGSPIFEAAVQALYGVSYAVKFLLRRERGIEHKVSPLEGLWWTSEGTLLDAPRKAWEWTLMIRQPDELDGELLERAVAAKELPAAPLLELERFEEGPAAQVLHIGPYSAEGPTIERLHRFIRDAGFEPRGKHHEIYVGDPRRAAPEKLRTILRQPISPLAPAL